MLVFIFKIMMALISIKNIGFKIKMNRC